jgi:C1A family cysteine protease
MCIVGYEPGRFRVANSWGTDWREHGFAWLTDSYLAWEQTQDVWVLSLA